MPIHPYLARPLDESPLIEFLIDYFHEDWRLDDATESAVVHRFVVHAQPADVRAVIHDLDEVLAAWTDSGVRDLLHRHVAGAIDLRESTAQQWLVWLRTELSAMER